MDCKWVALIAVVIGLECDCLSQVVVTVPNGGEQWDGGSRQYVRWTGGGQSLRVELTTNSGFSWAVLSPSVPVGYRMLGFECPDVSSVECRVRITSIEDTSHSDVSDSVFSIRSSSIGRAWVQRNSGTLADLRSVTFIDQSHGWICGDNGTLLTTSNGGVSWESLNSNTTNHLYSIRFSRNLVGIAVGTNGTIRRSTNEGTTWQEVVSGTANNLYGVAFHGEGTASAVGANGTIIRSIDTGLSWQPVTSGTTSTLRAVSFLDPFRGAVAGGDGPYGGGGHFVLISTNAGSSWTLKPTDTDYFAFQSISYLSDSVMIVAGDYSFSFGSNSAIAKSTNGGDNWLSVFGFSNVGSFGPIFFFADLMFVDSTRGFVVGGGDGCGMFVRTTTGGASWDLSRAYYFGGQYMIAVWFVTPTNGTIVGSGGAILQTSSGGLVSIGDNATQSSVRTFRLLQNYPNPFNPTTTIRFEIPNAAFVSLKVFDTLGKEVAILANEEMSPGVYEKVLHTKSLASGMYLYRLEAGNSIRTSKLMLLK